MDRALFLSIYLFFQLILPLAALANDIKNWGLGPLEIEETFPLIIQRERFSPETTKVTESGFWDISTRYQWTNTLNRNRSIYLIDAEERETIIDIKRGINDGVELAVSMPFYYEGSGVLDELIDKWHHFFSLPEGARDDEDARNDKFIIQGNLSDDNRLSLDERGISIGDFKLKAKKVFFRGDHVLPAVSGIFGVKLPSGSNRYTSDTLEFQTRLLLSKRLRKLIFYTGTEAIYALDKHDVNSSLLYPEFRYAGFLSCEYEVFSKATLTASILATSSMVDNLETFPDYGMYLDFGGKYQFLGRFIFSLGIRENPIPGRGTSDFSMFFQINIVNI